MLGGSSRSLHPHAMGFLYVTSLESTAGALGKLSRSIVQAGSLVRRMSDRLGSRNVIPVKRRTKDDKKFSTSSAGIWSHWRRVRFTNESQVSSGFSGGIVLAGLGRSMPSPNSSRREGTGAKVSKCRSIDCPSVQACRQNLGSREKLRR